MAPRYHYLCRRVTLDWQSSLPEGCTLRRIDRELLANPDLALSEDLGEEEIVAYWGSVAHFLERGIGFCVLHGGEEVSHCTADCAAGTTLPRRSKARPLLCHEQAFFCFPARTSPSGR